MWQNRYLAAHPTGSLTGGVMRCSGPHSDGELRRGGFADPGIEIPKGGDGRSLPECKTKDRQRRSFVLTQRGKIVLWNDCWFKNYLPSARAMAAWKSF